jgi:hypothetical protein
MEKINRTFGIFEIRRRTSQCPRNDFLRTLLMNDRIAPFLSRRQESLTFRLFDARKRHFGPIGNNLANILLRNMNAN